VTGFTWASRRRLLKAIGTIPWSVLGDRWFLTLTYPGEYPHDGRTVKAHLKAFRKRVERRYGRLSVCVWKLEFQKRGAPHLHMLLPAAALGALDEFQQWCSAVWFEIVGSGDLRHLAAGTNVQLAVTDCARYFSYALNEKGYQEQVPAGFVNCGRFWGIWGFRPEWAGALLTEGEYITLRRTARAWSRSKGRDVRPGSRWAGSWYLTDNPRGAFVLMQIVRVLDRDVSALLI
jgi:hypothetical protein